MVIHRKFLGADVQIVLISELFVVCFFVVSFFVSFTDGQFLVGGGFCLAGYWLLAIGCLE